MNGSISVIQPRSKKPGAGALDRHVSPVSPNLNDDNELIQTLQAKWPAYAESYEPFSRRRRVHRC